MDSYGKQEKGIWKSIPTFIRVLIVIAVSIPVLVFVGALLYMLPPVVTGGFMGIAALVILALKTK